MAEVAIRPARAGDAGELLTLQRAAYVSEAQLYGDPKLAPLTQTLEELRAELAAGPALVALDGARIIGSARARIADRTLHIGRIIVAPDRQGRGVGTRLLTEIERLGVGAVDRFALFTGHLSLANIRLYERLGYREVRREPAGPGLVLVHLAKSAPA